MRGGGVPGRFLPRLPGLRVVPGQTLRYAQVITGALLEHHAWGSVFLITLPLAVIAVVLAILLVPSHVNETTDPVDNPGGILSIVAVAALVLAINFAPVPDRGTSVLVTSVLVVVAAT